MDPIQLELFTNRFQSIAATMGEMLRRTSVSTNVKERLDFSCALLDSDAALVVNAPHIPVHLGAMELCVKRVRETLALSPGDVVITNHPAYGGSHLPDVTVITPVFHHGQLIGHVANRAHHAEIGGTRPGSMPPAARTLEEEGVAITPRYLAQGGEFDWQGLADSLSGARWPSRNIDHNLADIRAAVAANRTGADALCELANSVGPDVVAKAMTALQDQAASQAEAVIASLGQSTRQAIQRLDDGHELHVRIVPGNGRLLFDFEGTSPVHPGNLNATPAIVHAVVLYVIRLLARGLKPELPLNGGLFRKIDIRIPDNCLLNPDFSRSPAPAVVGGNVEVSQRLTDTLIQALDIAACSQGTMNNLLFGNDRFGYYETICGGEGASSGSPGASGVHTHMTNTRITDPEVLEARYPVRLERFELRRGSGGEGQHPGGDGIVRELRFLEPMSVSMLTQHRTEEPFGAHGGAPGKRGNQQLLRPDGRTVALDHTAAFDAEAGDTLRIETPGGGGWGRPTRG